MLCYVKIMTLGSHLPRPLFTCVTFGRTGLAHRTSAFLSRRKTHGILFWGPLSSSIHWRCWSSLWTKANFCPVMKIEFSWGTHLSLWSAFHIGVSFEVLFDEKMLYIRSSQDFPPFWHRLWFFCHSCSHFFISAMRKLGYRGDRTISSFLFNSSRKRCSKNMATARSLSSMWILITLSEIVQ